MHSFLLLRELGLLAMASSCLVLSACSSEDSGGNTGGNSGMGAISGSGGSSANAGASGGGGSSGSAGGVTCDGPPGYSSGVITKLVEDFQARVVDLDGNPAPDIQATVCGTDLCIYGSTDAQGRVVTCDKDTGVCTTGIQPRTETGEIQPLNKPAFKFAQGLSYVKWAYILPAEGVLDIGDFTTAKLPDVSTSVPMVAGAQASSSGVLLDIPAGATIEIDPFVYETTAQQGFRAVEIPMAKAPPAVDASLGFEILIGTTPLETHFCPPATLSVPNTAGWAAGTAAEIWLHGIDPGEDYAPYGEWGKLTDATVSADGKLVVTNPGEGVPILGLFGIRKK